MSKLTENAIKESFLKLLNEKPINQITVKDIVQDCGINRNSFYYHFADIPTLLETIITEEVDKVISEHPNIASIEDCLVTSVDFAKKNKRAIMHIFNSVNRAIFEQYLWKVCEYAVNAYINTVVVNRSLPEKEVNLLTLLLKCECFGIVIEWMNQGMSDTIYENIHSLSEMRNEPFEQLLTRIENARG